MSEAMTRRILVHGRVQGVGFRESLRQEASRRGLAGWVRNRRDGSVEAVLHGAPHCVEEMVAWAAHGPPSAQVTSIDVETAAGTFEGFEHRPTA